MKTIIALTGPKGVGKSTLAKLLSVEYGYYRSSFAVPIKAMLRSLLEYQGADEDTINQMLYGNLKEVNSIYLGDRSFRHAAQALGTEWRDLIHLELWTKIWANRIASVENKKIVVDDMRFLHEAKAVDTYPNATTFKILIERAEYSPGAHLSEREYLHIIPDYVISNDMDKYNMLERVRYLVGDFL